MREKMVVNSGSGLGRAIAMVGACALPFYIAALGALGTQYVMKDTDYCKNKPEVQKIAFGLCPKQK